MCTHIHAVWAHLRKLFMNYNTLRSLIEGKMTHGAEKYLYVGNTSSVIMRGVSSTGDHVPRREIWHRTINVASISESEMQMTFLTMDYIFKLIGGV